jgi:hypothetical protein
MHKKFYCEDDKSRAVGPFGKLRDRVTEALARHSRVGGNPERYTLQRMDPRIREDDKNATGRPSASSGPGLRRLSPVIPA